MNRGEISSEQLIKAQKRANTSSKKLIRVLGLDDMVVRNNKVIRIHPDGSEVVVQDSRFKTVKAVKGTFQIKNE